MRELTGTFTVSPGETELTEAESIVNLRDLSFGTVSGICVGVFVKKGLRVRRQQSPSPLQPLLRTKNEADNRNFSLCLCNLNRHSLSLSAASLSSFRCVPPHTLEGKHSEADEILMTARARSTSRLATLSPSTGAKSPARTTRTSPPGSVRPPPREATASAGSERGSSTLSAPTFRAGRRLCSASCSGCDSVRAHLLQSGAMRAAVWNNYIVLLCTGCFALQEGDVTNLQGKKPRRSGPAKPRPALGYIHDRSTLLGGDGAGSSVPIARLAATQSSITSSRTVSSQLGGGASCSGAGASAVDVGGRDIGAETTRGRRAVAVSARAADALPTEDSIREKRPPGSVLALLDANVSPACPAVDSRLAG